MDDKVTSYISKNRKMLINGQWVEAASGKTFPTYNPATGEVLARVAEGDREDIDRAVKAARAAFETGPWSKMTPSERGRLIWKLGDLLEQNLEEFAELEMLDNGKPLKIARVADVPLAVDLFRYMAGWATKIEGNTIPIGGKFLAYTLRLPVGVVGQIIPWNFPLLMAAWKLGPALRIRVTVAPCTTLLTVTRRSHSRSGVCTTGVGRVCSFSTTTSTGGPSVTTPGVPQAVCWALMSIPRVRGVGKWKRALPS